MFEKLNLINRQKNIEIIASVLILVAIILLLNVFAVYYSTKLNLSNPLIPKCLAFEIFEPYALKGIILTIGLLIATILKLFKQHLIVILICLLIIALYYLTRFEANLTEYQ